MVNVLLPYLAKFTPPNPFAMTPDHVLFAVVLMLTSLGPAPSFLMVPPDSDPCKPAGLMLLRLPRVTLKPLRSSTPVPLICIAVTAVLLFVWMALGGVVTR